MRQVSHREIESVSTGLFPAEAGPTDTLAPQMYLLANGLWE